MRVAAEVTTWRPTWAPAYCRRPEREVAAAWLWFRQLEVRVRRRASRRAQPFGLRAQNGKRRTSATANDRSVAVTVLKWNVRLIGRIEQKRGRRHTQVEIGLQLVLNAETSVGRLEEEAEAKQRIALLDRLHESALDLNAEHLLRLRRAHLSKWMSDENTMQTLKLKSQVVLQGKGTLRCACDLQLQCSVLIVPVSILNFSKPIP